VRSLPCRSALWPHHQACHARTQGQVDGVGVSLPLSQNRLLFSPLYATDPASRATCKTSPAHLFFVLQSHCPIFSPGSFLTSQSAQCQRPQLELILGTWDLWHSRSLDHRPVPSRPPLSSLVLTAQSLRGLETAVCCSTQLGGSPHYNLPAPFLFLHFRG
jgi:hypothetical protein